MTETQRSRLIDKAIALHRAGDEGAAAAIYDEVLGQLPDDYDALYLLGIAEYQRKSNSRAIRLLARAVAAGPGQPAAHNALGLALRRAGQATEAADQFRQALTCEPSSAATHYHLGLTLFDLNDIDGAIDSYHTAIEIAPNHHKALYHLALALHHSNRWREACESLRRALEAHPGFPAAYLELAFVLRANGEATEAAQVLKRGLSSCPGDVDFLAKTGHLLAELRQWKTAARCFRKALELDPRDVPAQLGLGVVEVESSQEARGLPRFENVLRSHPLSAEAHFHRARALCGLGQIEAGIDGFRRAQELGLETGKLNIASVIPGDPRADNSQILHVRREWADSMPRRRREASKFGQRRRGDKLRIGYVSRSFQHRNWMKPVWALLNSHDRRHFAVHLFSDAPEGQVEYGYAPQPGDAYHDTRSLGSPEFAALIERCGIDILIDLNSYGAMKRLAVFALKPAPLVVGWFNCFATIGMAEFDYLIGDREVISSEEEPFYVERIVRVPGSYLTFNVNYPVPDVAPPPCLQRGHLTFGSMCSLYKLTNHVVETWADILKQCRSARLFLKNAGLKSASNREWLAAKFDGLGVDRSRLRLEGPSEHDEFLTRYAEIDLALDAFPYNGGTTTTEAIWQGVPVITFRGDRWASRTSASLLVNGGLGEFVADDREAYVRMAVELANDPATPDRLADLRREMRRRLKASPVCDVAGFARNMERIYSDFWAGWENRSTGC